MWDTAIFLKLLMDKVSEDLADSESDGLLPTSQRSHINKGVFFHNTGFSKTDSAVVAPRVSKRCPAWLVRYTFSESSEDRAVFHRDQKLCLLRGPRLFSCPLLSWAVCLLEAPKWDALEKMFSSGEPSAGTPPAFAGQRRHASLSRPSIRDVSCPLVVWSAERTADLDFLSQPTIYLEESLFKANKHRKQTNKQNPCRRVI